MFKNLLLTQTDVPAQTCPEQASALGFIIFFLSSKCYKCWEKEEDVAREMWLAHGDFTDAEEKERRWRQSQGCPCSLGHSCIPLSIPHHAELLAEHPARAEHQQGLGAANPKAQSTTATSPSQTSAGTLLPKLGRSTSPQH